MGYKKPMQTWIKESDFFVAVVLKLSEKCCVSTLQVMFSPVQTL